MYMSTVSENRGTQKWSPRPSHLRHSDQQEPVHCVIHTHPSEKLNSSPQQINKLLEKKDCFSCQLNVTVSYTMCMSIVCEALSRAWALALGCILGVGVIFSGLIYQTVLYHLRTMRKSQKLTQIYPFWNISQ